MSLLINPDDPELGRKLDSLQPERGHCIFVDIVGSTEMKAGGIRKWVAMINNTFANARSFLMPFAPLKSIGDELMFFISDMRLQKTGESSLGIFSGMASIAQEEEPYYRDVRIAVAYCEQAYDITFMPGVPDVYGRDIDLTARLLTLAGSREVVMNEAFVERVRADYGNAGNKEQFPEVELMVGPWLERLKGFDEYVRIYKLPDIRKIS